MVETVRIQEDREGTYVVLPEGIGFGIDVEVEVTRVDDVIFIRRVNPPPPPNQTPHG
jgi:hypothetical protein